MGPYYFKKQFPQGKVSIQIRYFSSPDRMPYKALIIRENNNGGISQSTQDISNEDFESVRNDFTATTKSDFSTIQKKALGTDPQELYKQFYADWKNYYLKRKLSVENSKPLKGWEYCDKLESEYINNGVYTAREALIKQMNGIMLQPNPILHDLYQDARQSATMDFVTNKI